MAVFFFFALNIMHYSLIRMLTGKILALVRIFGVSRDETWITYSNHC